MNKKLAVAVLSFSVIAGCGSEGDRGASRQLFTPMANADADSEIYTSIDELLRDSTTVAVVQVLDSTKTLETGDGDPLINTTVTDANVRTVTAGPPLPPQIRLATVFLEPNPDDPTGVPHRIDDKVLKPDREYLLFLEPFRYKGEVWSDTFTLTGDVVGVFERAAGSEERFLPVVFSEFAIVDSISEPEVVEINASRASS